MFNNTFVEDDLLSHLDATFIKTYPNEIKKAQNSDSEELYAVGCEYTGNPSWRPNPKYDPQKGFVWLLLSSLKNNADAQYGLYKMYFTGTGVKEDKLAAFGWLLKAASNGHKNARSSIGNYFSSYYNHYYRGILPEDNYKAMEWYRTCDYHRFTLLIMKQRWNCYLTKEDKNKSISQLIVEAEELLNAAIKKKKDEEEEREREQKMRDELKKFKKARKVTKQQLRENFDPFLFRSKRK